MLNLRRGVVGVVTVLLASGVASPLLAQQAAQPPPTQSPGAARLSSEQVLDLSLGWVHFLAVLTEVRALESEVTDIGQMLINNRISANKMKSPFLFGGLRGEPPYLRGSPEQALIEGLSSFRDIKLVLADKTFAILRAASETTSAADIRTLPGDIAILAGEMDELWRQLPLYAGLLAHILVDDIRVVDNRTPYLRLTSQQIATLKQRLEQVVPGVGTTKGSFFLEVSASLLYEFLDSGYKAADAVP